MKRLTLFLVLVAAVMVVEASLIRHPRATSVVPAALQPTSVTVSPLQGEGVPQAAALPG